MTWPSGPARCRPLRPVKARACRWVIARRGCPTPLPGRCSPLTFVAYNALPTLWWWPSTCTYADLSSASEPGGQAPPGRELQGDDPEQRLACGPPSCEMVSELMRPGPSLPCGAELPSALPGRSPIAIETYCSPATARATGPVFWPASRSSEWCNAPPAVTRWWEAACARGPARRLAAANGPQLLQAGSQPGRTPGRAVCR